MAPTSKRKRRRTWETVRSLGLVVLSSALPSALGQSSIYATCREQLRSVDIDGDEALSEAEFKAFLFQISGGRAIFGNSDLPAAIVQAFADRQDGSTQLMDISASSGGALDFFCKETYSGLFELFDVSVSNNDCIQALQAGDTQPMNGKLGTIEYVPFLNSLTVSQDYSEPFEELPPLLLDAFNDMAVDGVIDGSKGTEYLVAFCQRVLLAAITPPVPPTPAPTLLPGSTALPTLAGSINSKGDTPAPSSAGTGTTPAPSAAGSGITIAPTSSNSRATILPTLDSTATLVPTAVLGKATVKPTSTSSMEDSSTGSPAPIGGTISPTVGGSFEAMPTTISGSIMPTPQGSATSSVDDAVPTQSPTWFPTIIERTQAPTFASISVTEFNTCKTALIVADINRNDKLEQQDFVRFISRMATDHMISSYAAFSSIDKIFRDLYNNLAAEASDSVPRLEGTKPGTTPSRDERANILNICQETYQAIKRYDRDGPSSDDDEVSDDDSNGSDGDTGEFFQNCKSAMVVSDLNRDNVLEESEFVRFTTRLMPDIYNRPTAFKQLEPEFRTSFFEVTSPRGVAIFGSKPGQRSTDTQNAHLESVCKSVKKAIDTISARGEASNPLPPPTSSPTMKPESITTEFFRKCKTAMLISDLDRDDMLDPQEYVRLLNRLTLSQFAGNEFDELDAIFQLGFYKVAVGGRVDVSGSKPGQMADRTTTTHLSNVCLSVKQSLDIFVLTGGSPPIPAVTKAPTPASPEPSSSPITRSELRNCQEGITRADVNRNFLLEEEEFAKFLGPDTTFLGLPIDYQFAFLEAAGGGEAVDLASVDTSHIIHLCEEIPAQGDLVTIPPRPSCTLSLFTSDLNGNNRLTEDEYVGFVNSLRGSDASSFDTLPFLLRDNFAWVILKRTYIDINGVESFQGLDSGDDIRIQWMCERTNHVLSALGEDDSITLDDHCESALRLSDDDVNGYIDEEEFVDLLRRFSGANFSGLDFQSISSKSRKVFNAATSNDNNMVDVETASANGFCFELQIATDEERESEAFFEQCLASLRGADENFDESLSKEEYVPFLYNLAIVYGLIEDFPTGLEYENLNQVLRLNYDVLAGQNDSVLILGAQSQPSDSQYEALRWVCQNTEGIVDLISETQETRVTVYNAFYISNTKGLVAADLKSGPDRNLLEAAYSEFVEDQIRVILRLRRTRSLSTGEYVPSTASIYQIDDVKCFPDLSAGSLCQVVYANFDLSLSEQEDAEVAAAKYSETTQATIDRGALQLKLILLDSTAAFNIEQAVDPVKPSSGQIFVPTRKPGVSVVAAPEDEEASLFLTLISGALVSAAIFGTLYYWFFYIRRGKTLFGEDKVLGISGENESLPGKRPEQTDASRTGDDEETGLSIRIKKVVSTKVSTLEEDSISVPDESSMEGSFADFVKSVSKATSSHSDSQDEESSSNNTSNDSASSRMNPSESSESERSKLSGHQSISSSGSEGVQETPPPETFPSSTKSRESVMNDKIEPSISESSSISEDDRSLSLADDVDSTQSSASEVLEEQSHDLAMPPSNTESKDNSEAASDSHGESVSEDLDQEGLYDIDESKGDEEDVDGESRSFDEADTLVHSTMSLDTTYLNASYEKYRPIVEELVRLVVPDEINNVDTMMEQFIGREKELVRTLRNMAGIEDSEEDDSDDFEPSDYSESSNHSDISGDEVSEGDEDSLDEESDED